MADQYTDEELRKLPLDDPPEDEDDSKLENVIEEDEGDDA